MKHFVVVCPDATDAKSIVLLWKQVLKNDPKWHFFFEGNVFFVRVSDEHAPAVEEWFKENNLPYRNEGEYHENVVPEPYIEDFIHIFHWFSEVAMKSQHEDWNKFNMLVDRVIHCFMNMTRTQDRVGLVETLTGSYMSYEPFIIATNAVNRGFMIGRIFEAKKHEDKS